MKTITSSLFSLDWKDGAKGLLMAIIGAIISVVTASINAGNFNITWAAIWHGAVVAGFAYLTKNFFTESKEVAPANPIAK
ncbi:MAG: hypothetical protein P4L31_07535 [Candidatus Babeliales bacterium]|nr:hypothetical protein [Candidatus Babeliales bacterium]